MTLYEKLLDLLSLLPRPEDRWMSRKGPFPRFHSARCSHTLSSFSWVLKVVMWQTVRCEGPSSCQSLSLGGTLWILKQRAWRHHQSGTVEGVIKKNVLILSWPEFSIQHENGDMNTLVERWKWAPREPDHMVDDISGRWGLLEAWWHFLWKRMWVQDSLDFDVSMISKPSMLCSFTWSQ